MAPPPFDAAAFEEAKKLAANLNDSPREPGLRAIHAVVHRDCGAFTTDEEAYEHYSAKRDRYYYYKDKLNKMHEKSIMQALAEEVSAEMEVEGGMPQVPAPIPCELPLSS